QQRDDGTLARVRSVDREAVKAAAHERLTLSLGNTEEACGTSLKVHVDWADLSDEAVGNPSVVEHCKAAIWALEDLCESSAGRAFVRGSIDRLECDWGNELAIEVADGTLTVRSDAESAEVRDYVRAQLLEQPIGSAKTLRDAVHFAQTDICVAPDS